MLVFFVNSIPVFILLIFTEMAITRICTSILEITLLFDFFYYIHI